MSLRVSSATASPLLVTTQDDIQARWLPLQTVLHLKLWGRDKKLQFCLTFYRSCVNLGIIKASSEKDLDLCCEILYSREEHYTKPLLQ